MFDGGKTDRRITYLEKRVADSDGRVIDRVDGLERRLVREIKALDEAAACRIKSLERLLGVKWETGARHVEVEEEEE
jgi:hypothetical protein